MEMDLPCPEWIRHVEQKWTRLESPTRGRLSVFTDIDDLFHFGESQLQPEDLEALSRISEKNPVKKSSECAARFREQGNVSFKEKDYTSAGLYYTQVQNNVKARKTTPPSGQVLCLTTAEGVCHAEKNTEELSLCYANRSAALFHLGLYTKCLEDIQQAFDEGYPSYLQRKLMDRQLRCTSLVKMQEFQKVTPKHQTPQTKKNKGVNARMSPAVSVNFAPEKGRYLLATENKSAGEIMVEDEAFSFVLIPVKKEYKKTIQASIFTKDTSLPVQSSKELRIATAVFPILSLLNHACQPNTSISFSLGLRSSGSSSPEYFSSGLKVTVRACRDIAAGQELLHCYGPHSSRLDVEKRQCLLLMQYFFQCQCEDCKLELAHKSKILPLTFNGLKCEKCGNFLEMSVDMHVCSHCDHRILNTELQKRMQILQHQLKQAVELMENNQINGALSILHKATTLADSFLMKVHTLQGELADATARAYATMGLWRKAASHLKYSIDAICSQYGKDSVELGRQQHKLAQLHFNGGDGLSALSVIPLARRLLTLHCDPHCTELQELQAMEACLMSTM
ncbi:SET and MYND domain-containing protein 4 isoform X3 [Silurus meridionalis]|uniref:SET and MYND domain-containing protein 4 isoform X3 n=1 Tax=Silurus meridionalis TaxID=175797 RepID=UPI001EEBDBD8|nr:SET and MYND domain-containing protein 4 isoform X3 [Silurus meridionalis]